MTDTIGGNSDVTIINKLGLSVGGKDKESIESIRFAGPQVLHLTKQVGNSRRL